MTSNAQLGGERVVGNHNTLSFSSSDPEVLKAALDKVTELAAATTGSLSDLVSQSHAADAASRSDILGAIQQIADKNAQLAADAQTGGDSSRNNIILAIVAGVLILLGLVFYRR